MHLLAEFYIKKYRTYKTDTYSCQQDKALHTTKL